MPLTTLQRDILRIIAGNRSEESHFAAGLVLNAGESSVRYSRDFDIFPLHAIIWAACGKDPGFSPGLLLEMMRRFARINPRQLETIQARQLDPVALKLAWIEMSDRAEVEITRVADTMPDVPVGVAFVDAQGMPGWIGDDPALHLHGPTVRGCLPQIAGVPPL